MVPGILSSRFRICPGSGTWGHFTVELLLQLTMASVVAGFMITVLRSVHQVQNSSLSGIITIMCCNCAKRQHVREIKDPEELVKAAYLALHTLCLQGSP